MIRVNRDKKVKKIAEETRKWGERVARDLEKKGRRVYSSEDLGMMCSVCSYRLFNNLVKAGYSPWFATLDGHTFVLLDGFVIDVTATQFGEKEKVIIKKQSGTNRWFWNPTEMYKVKEKIDKEMKRWHASQSYTDFEALCKKLEVKL